ncbi:hypothetical protein V8G54_011239, partial [Vigna mungo]
ERRFSSCFIAPFNGIAHEQERVEVRDKQSHTASSSASSAQVTAEKMSVFSTDKTTVPFARVAILPVSGVITRKPISNGSVEVSRYLEVATVVVAPPKPRRPEEWLSLLIWKR